MTIEPPPLATMLAKSFRNARISVAVTCSSAMHKSLPEGSDIAPRPLPQRSVVGPKKNFFLGLGGGGCKAGVTAAIPASADLVL